LRKKSLLYSAKFRFTILGSLVIITLILLYLFYFRNSNISTDKNNFQPDPNIKSTDTVISDPQKNLERSIDSILFTFGIKKEWITNEPQKKPNIRAEWFVKNVIIPKDLTTVEVNLDINTLVNKMGLKTTVNENILNKDIVITIVNPDTARNTPAAILQITHSEKAVRETGVIALIIDKINTFNNDDIDKLILTKSEFSYVFPRNLDDIDIQQKLLHNKKDIIINLTVAGKDNYEADFSLGMEDKIIHDKIKSFNSDYTSVNKVLLTNVNHDVSLNNFCNKIAGELIKGNIRIINDSMCIAPYNSKEKDRLSSFFNILIQKVNQSRNIIAIYPADKSEFEDFYNKILIYKKLGYKFYNLSDYFSYIESIKRREQVKEEKKDEKDKKKQEDVKKKKTDKKIDIPNKNKDKKPIDKGGDLENQPNKQPQKKKK